MKTNFKKQKGYKLGLKDNVRKTALRTAAVIVSFVLISLTVSAQDFWKNLLLNSSFNEIALALSDHPGESGKAEKSANSTIKAIYTEKDEKLLLEPWMTHEYLFGFSATALNSNVQIPLWHPEESLRTSLLVPLQAVEEPLKLKSWMISEHVWGSAR